MPNQSDSGGEACSNPSPESNVLGSDRLRGNEAGNGNVQPLVVVNRTLASAKLYIPINSLLPLSHMGDASLQSPQPPTNIEPIMFPPFLFPHHIPKSETTPWNSVETDPIFLTMVHNEVRESPSQVVPNISTSTSQVMPHPRTPPPPQVVSGQEEEIYVREIEEAIVMLRET
ncbi:hypothetical protein KY284_019319 [Solanum tuberosum]|nr:hypothetical protein KY284_019319 [Solanum tuberosum]